MTTIFSLIPEQLNDTGLAEVVSLCNGHLEPRPKLPGANDLKILSAVQENLGSYFYCKQLCYSLVGQVVRNVTDEVILLAIFNRFQS